ncbi:TIGR02391 family protein [Dactylosporangium sp. CS-047395]|uniref:TIGR02391 family protein n=1 Tax=Dactylosporangium sp. CS-047395 TaxID=3239936 RepID=UPI003D8F2D71
MYDTHTAAERRQLPFATVHGPFRVRELAGAGDSDIGVKLMRQAFAGGGPLADPALDGGERDAVSALFAGALGVFTNPSSHRQVTYADPTVRWNSSSTEV